MAEVAHDPGEIDSKILHNNNYTSRSADIVDFLSLSSTYMKQ